MKKLAFLILSVVMSLSFAACTKKEVVSNPGEGAQEQKKVVIGLDENFPPMGFKDSTGQLVGFDIDLAKEACAIMGAEAVFQPIDWNAKEQELGSKRVDLLWNGVTITDKRKETMLFTKPYLKNKQVILVKNDSTIATKADLAGKTVGVQKASSAVAAVAADTDVAATLKATQEYSDNLLAFTDLDIGRIDAVVVDEIVARYHLSTAKPDFKVLDENFGDEEYGVAMRLDDTELNANLQKALDEMNTSGKSTEISKKWFNEDIVVK